MMKRYQLYLNPHSVSIIDELENLTDISRSKVIRYIVDSVSEQFITLIRRKEPKEQYLMDSLSGFIDLKTKKRLDLVKDLDKVILQSV